jgi:hypothetical protein
MQDGPGLCFFARLTVTTVSRLLDAPAKSLYSYRSVSKDATQAERPPELGPLQSFGREEGGLCFSASRFTFILPHRPGVTQSLALLGPKKEERQSTPWVGVRLALMRSPQS